MEYFQINFDIFKFQSLNMAADSKGNIYCALLLFLCKKTLVNMFFPCQADVLIESLNWLQRVWGDEQNCITKTFNTWKHQQKYGTALLRFLISPKIKIFITSLFNTPLLFITKWTLKVYKSEIAVTHGQYCTTVQYDWPYIHSTGNVKNKLDGWFKKGEFHSNNL